MKRTVLFVMAIVMIAVMTTATGCGSKSDLESSVEKIFRQTAELRCLPQAEGVKFFFVNPKELAALCSAPSDEETIKEISSWEEMYRFLYPDEQVSYQSQLQNRGEQVLGLYFPEENEFYVLESEDVGRLDWSEKLTCAHEYDHALVYCHHNFSSLEEKVGDNTDAFLALEALCEGDAILLENLYSRIYLSDREVDQMIEYEIEMAMMGMEATPSFAHDLGPSFVGYVAGNQQGEIDWKLVDELYLNPPRSTEQIIHPERYLDGDNPRNVSMPDLLSDLGGDWKQKCVDSWGELGFLSYFASLNESFSVDSAGEGWGGDRCSFLMNEDGERVFVSSSVWDTSIDSSEVFDFLFRYLAPEVLQWKGTRNERTISWTSLEGRVYHLSQKGDEILFVVGEEEDTVAKAVSAFKQFE